jgi:hypothetical protein
MVLISLAVVAALVFGINQWLYLDKAHSTFEDYYAFRGCVQLISTTTDSGMCRDDSGEIIKIVKYQNEWYLDGDLPWACWSGICFGL